MGRKKRGDMNIAAMSANSRYHQARFSTQKAAISMASTKKSAPKAKQTQAERLLEVAQKTRAAGGGNTFARSTGKATLTRNARKAARLGKP
jgi:hypothetical protein